MTNKVRPFARVVGRSLTEVELAEVSGSEDMIIVMEGGTVHASNCVQVPTNGWTCSDVRGYD